MNKNEPVLLPAMRARLGDWWYYVATMTFDEIAKRVKKVSEVHEKKELKTWIQREIKTERLEEIAAYIRNQPQRFFNGLVLGIYGGDPDWMPVTVTENLARPEDELNERSRSTFGFIRLAGTEEIFAIDGQHRVEGIKLALRLDVLDEFTNDEQTVLFVSHKESDSGRERTRRLFATLNKYAKPVSKGEIIALSEDDSFAIVTRQLVDSYPGLGSEFVPLLKNANLTSNDKRSLTSLITLYEVVKTVSLPSKSRRKRQLETGPPNLEQISELTKIAIAFWDALKKQFPEIAEVCSSAPDDELAGKFRHQSGGHLLFRPFGLTAFAKAARVLMDRGVTIDSAVQLLTGSQMEISEDPWCNVLWDPHKKVVITKNGPLVKNLLLVNACQPTDPEDFDEEEVYHKVTGEAWARHRTSPKPTAH
jgi:DNA sulfur modification protein DndB